MEYYYDIIAEIHIKQQQKYKNNNNKKLQIRNILKKYFFKKKKAADGAGTKNQRKGFIITQIKIEAKQYKI